jgi:hypothetical protein
MKKTLNMCALVTFAGGAVLTVAPAARAASVDCTTLTHPVYIAGSSASQSYLQQIAELLPTLNLLYASSASCVGIGDIVTTGQTESAAFSHINATTGALETCTGSGAAPYQAAINVDIGVSDVYPETCITPTVPSPLPAAFKLYDGAVQAMEIAVPYASSEFSISADAAYVVFGFAGQSFNGTTYAISPWTVPTDIWTRGDTSGTQLMIAAAIGLNGAKWLTPLGADAGAAQIANGSGPLESDLVTSAALAAGPDPVIGILSNAKVDPFKMAGGVRALAFQAKDQDCGYYPDSTKDLFDKINVRQGRYQIWGYEHFVTNVSGGKAVASPAAASNPVTSVDADVQTVINVLTHTGLTGTATASLPTLQSVVAAETAAYFIPQCAMQVSRTSEVGPEASFQPAEGCGCLYESLPTGGAGTLSSYCQTCTKATQATDCTMAPYTTCNDFGYCEVQ